MYHLSINYVTVTLNYVSVALILVMITATVHFTIWTP